MNDDTIAILNALQRRDDAEERRRNKLFPELQERQAELVLMSAAVINAIAILHNDLYRTRVHNALAELESVEDIAFNHYDSCE